MMTLFLTIVCLAEEVSDSQLNSDNISDNNQNNNSSNYSDNAINTVSNNASEESLIVDNTSENTQGENASLDNMFSGNTTAENVSSGNVTRENISNVTSENLSLGKELLEDGLLNSTPSQNLEIVRLLPGMFNIGDVQFNIEVNNTGTESISNIAAYISGKGFSTYNIIPLRTLNPGETGYIIVMGNFKEQGNIVLNMIIHNFEFNYTVPVLGPSNADDSTGTLNPEEKQKHADELNVQLEALEEQYKLLEEEYYKKKRDNFDISGIDLADLKNSLRDTRTKMLTGDINIADASLNLAQKEYLYQKDKLENAVLLKKSALDLLRNNAVLISSLAGAIIAIFTLFELLKQKTKILEKMNISKSINKTIIKSKKSIIKTIKNQKNSSNGSKNTNKAYAADDFNNNDDNNGFDNDSNSDNK